MKSQYIIILTIITITVASMLLLAKIEDTQRENNQNFWSIYFVDPMGTDTRFVIDNKTPEIKTFHYDIIVNEEMINSGDIEIGKNNRKLIELKELEPTESIMIQVTTNDEMKTIYKK